MTTFTPLSLRQRSLEIIADGQAPSGAYVASPTFSQYGFGWLRDGAYCALAMDAHGRRTSSRRFHEWVSAVLLSQERRIDGIVSALGRGEVVAADALLPTRFTLAGLPEGQESPEEWPNFQLDGYGTWLYALERHAGDDLSVDQRRAAAASARYIAALWTRPCYDYWEEYGDRLHTSTLVAIWAGLTAAARMLGDAQFGHVAEDVRDFIERECVVEGAFVKGPSDGRVDASLISLATPFDFVAVDDPRMRRTVDRIRTELSSPSGGIRRYVGDTYFGGSPWVLLTAWLGWHLARAGDPAGFAAARQWVEVRARVTGELAEQAIDEPQDAPFVDEWTQRWGSVADPLLWSHAKYLLMIADHP